MEAAIDLVEVILHDVGMVTVSFQAVHTSFWPLAGLQHTLDTSQVFLAELQLARTQIRIQMSARNARK